MSQLDELPDCVRALNENVSKARHLALELSERVAKGSKVLIDPSEACVESLRKGDSVSVFMNKPNFRLMGVVTLKGFYRTRERHSKDQTRTKVFAIIQTGDRPTPFVIDGVDGMKGYEDFLFELPCDEAFLDFQKNHSEIRNEATPEDLKGAYEWVAKKFKIKSRDFYVTKEDYQVPVDEKSENPTYYGQQLTNISALPVYRHRRP